MGGQMQQSNVVVTTAPYDHTGGEPLHNASPTNDAGNVVMARWKPGERSLLSFVNLLILEDKMMYIWLDSILDSAKRDYAEKVDVHTPGIIVDKNVYLPCSWSS